MSNVNGNDIDDLFKRAADKYPLRTDSADWNKLAADLDKDRSLIIPPVNMEGGDKRKRRRFLWLFLLLPLGGIGYYAFQSSKQPQAIVQHDSFQTPAKTEGGGDNTPPTESTGKTPVATGTPSGTAASAGAASRKEAATVRPSGTAARETPHTGESNSRTNPYVLASHLPTGSGLAERQTTHRSITKRPPTNGQITGKRKAKGFSTEQPGSEEQGSVSQRANPGTTVGDRNLSLSPLKSPRALTSGGVALDVTVNASKSPVTAKDSSGSKKNSGAKNKKQSFFYAGLLVAPDLSTIKFQSVKGVGTTFGVLLGYQFNRKWAVETGVSLDHKKYYTDGEYFKVKNPPSNYKLLNVDGYCNMWEIPVNLRYNISSGEKTKWFATAGLSTYLMTGEHYVSTEMYNGAVSTYPWDVKSPSQYWFSIINLSLGFEQKLGKIGNLRIEPYARIPLSGIGTGNLSIMSAGLNIGITRRIW